MVKLLLLLSINSVYAGPKLADPITLAAAHAGVPKRLLAAICSVESNGNPNAITYNDGKALQTSYGLCQVQPLTAKIFGYHGPAKGLLEPFTNTRYASLWLKYQLVRYKGDWLKAVAAYNSGTAKYKRGKLINASYIAKVNKVLLDYGK